MAIERKGNDKEVEALRAEAEQVESKVCRILSPSRYFWADES
jgi:hypothetical protein